MKAGQNQYAPMAGAAPLRHRIAEKTKFCGIDLDPDSEITITSGATEALFAAINAVVRQGDEVILFDPGYESYAPTIRLAGGIPVHIELRAPGYRIDWQQVQDALGPRTRLLIINSPHNPTGTTLRAEDLDGLELLLSQHRALVLSDEVYEHIVFDRRTHQSMLRRPSLRSRAFVVSSFGKTLHATGWKVGYCVAPPALTIELQKIHQFLTFTTCTPIQLAIAEFLEQQPAHYLELPTFYQAIARLVPRELARLTIRTAPLRRHLFSGPRLLANHPRKGHRLCPTDDHRPQPGLDTDLGLFQKWPRR